MRLGLLAVLATCAIALAGTPFGGDDTGFLPPDEATAKCGAIFAKATAKLAAGVLGCKVKGARSRIAMHESSGTNFVEDNCTDVWLNRFNKTAEVSGPTCPACIDTTSLYTQGSNDNINPVSAALFFCDSASGVQIDDETVFDLGWVPAGKAAMRCEAGAARAAGKAQLALWACHAREATGDVSGATFDGDACEVAAAAKFSAALQALTGCPACLAAILPNLPSIVSHAVNHSVGLIYCASPSGAFLD